MSARQSLPGQPHGAVQPSAGGGEHHLRWPRRAIGHDRRVQRAADHDVVHEGRPTAAGTFTTLETGVLQQLCVWSQFDRGVRLLTCGFVLRFAPRRVGGFDFVSLGAVDSPYAVLAWRCLRLLARCWFAVDLCLIFALFSLNFTSKDMVKRQ